MVLIGIAIQVAAVVPACRLAAKIPAGPLRVKWYGMTVLITVFIAGYLGYVLVLWDRPAEWRDLPIPGIFVVGAVFVWLTTNLALQTADALLRMRLLETENITDPLTRVYNRRYLERRLEEEFARSRRYALALSVLLVDIDHFKRVNDIFGHQAGDVALRAIGNLINTHVREPDVVARYGGEEFIVICVSTAIAEAVQISERLRHAVESHRVEIPDNSGGMKVIGVSVSIGAAGLGDGIGGVEALIQAADRALYRAKQEGRNRVIAATAESMRAAAA